MPRWKTILVPVDFEGSSAAAVDFALNLARKVDASIVLMHAYDPPAVSYAGDAFGASRTGASAIASAAQHGLHELVTFVKRDWQQVSSVLRRGTPWREILDVADDRDADLVVMGTHGHRGVTHVVLGSVAEQVVRASPVPVVTIRAKPPQARIAASR